eukprot:COSAG06_NODE_4408_length_4291_cov_570.385019_5_plen_101_part_00
MLELSNLVIYMPTYKQQFNKKYKQPLNQSNSLKDISRLTGYKLSGLKIIFNKGVGAYKTNPSSVRPHVKSGEQWAYSRVYAAVNPASKAYKIDKKHLKKV